MTFFPQRIFLGWNKPAVCAVADGFRSWMKRDAENFRRSLVLTPTRESARKLREETARLCGAVLMPKILPISALAEALAPFKAPAVVELAAWGETLAKLSGSLRAVFPSSPNWKGENLLDAAAHMQSLQRVLTAHGLPIREAAQRMKGTEENRWKELSVLFEAWEQVMSAAGFPKQINAPALPDSANVTGKIVIACIPELHLPARDLIASAGLPIEVWIHAPEETADLFSPWGEPLPTWKKHEIRIDGGDIIQTESSDELTARACSLLAQAPDHSSVGLCDPSLVTPLDYTLRESGVGLYRPDGIPLSGTGWISLLEDIKEHLEAPDYAAPLLHMAHSSLLAKHLHNEHFEYFCQALDKCAYTNFPEKTEYVTVLLEREDQREPGKMSLTETWESLVTWVQRTAKSGDSLLRALQALAEDCLEGDFLNVGFERNAAQSFLNEAASLSEYPGISSDFAVATLLHSLKTIRAESLRLPYDFFDALGWMELPFCPKKNLVLCGFHDGIIPEQPICDPFLHEKTVETFDFETREKLIARDSFLFASLIESHRAVGGTVTVLTARHTSSGEQNSPSSLLFRCHDEELVRRVSRLFGDSEKEISRPERDLGGWDPACLSRLLSAPNPHMQIEDLLNAYVNPWKNGERSFSPSKLNAFWQCPLRFWLRDAWHLDTQEITAEKFAFEPNEVGSILHNVLQKFAQLYPTRSSVSHVTFSALCEKAETLLQDELNSYTKHNYLPPTLQIFNMRRRLHAYVDLHCQELERGWECYLFEHEVGKTAPWFLQGHAMNFRVDRVDILRDQEGKIIEVRVVDYKTGKPTSPEKKCLTGVKGKALKDDTLFSTIFPELEYLPHTKAEKKRWTDLQMPIYTAWAIEWAKNEWGVAGSHSSVGTASSEEDVCIPVYPWYCFLPSDPEKTGMVRWDNFYMNKKEVSYFSTGVLWADIAMRNIEQGTALISAEQFNWGSPSFDKLKNVYGDALDWIITSNLRKGGSHHA